MWGQENRPHVPNVLTYRYTGDGQLFSTHDSKTDLTSQYSYDELGRLVASSVKDGNGVLLSTQQTYDANNQLTGQSWQMDGTTYAQTFTYNKVTGDLTAVSMPTGETLSYAYDDLQRLSVLSAGDLFTRTYHYRNRSNTQTTTQVSGVYYWSDNGEDCFDYEYDSLGNIISYTTSTGETTYYTYDSLGQLIEAENSYRFAYTYDKGGNILTASRNDETHTYTYGDANWADLLTAYDGQSITYDGSGNPLSYYNGTRYTFTWEEGRRLTSAVKNGSTYTYAYDLNGIRTSKVVDGVTHTYLYASGKLLRETYGDTVLDFFYDATGVPYAMNYTAGDTTTTYYYITNLQGDVIYMVDSNYNTAAYYIYDPYGKVLSASGSMGQINPLRYRGYYYDSETGFYYLQSRYYDPSICRFINADDTAYLGADGSLAGYNLFSYCANDPVNGSDSYGTWSLKKLIRGAKLIATGIAAVATGVTILACSAAAPVMLAVAGVTAISGAVTVANGAAEVAESVTGYNVIRDGLLSGNQELYETFRDVTASVAEIGTAICGSYYAAKGGNVCFVAGTLVQSECGAVPIETILPGDLVWAWDEKTGEVALKEVVETYINQTDELVHIFVNGEEIITTPSHPFYSPVKGWTDAVHLRAGDVLVLVNGEYVVVEKVQHEILETPVTVYNFQVEDFHTYYVTNSGVLVHNRCGGESPATKRGKQMHKSWDYGQNGATIKTEVTIPGVGRADAVDFVNRIVYELKPNNTRAIRQGWKQLTRYANALEADGSNWIRILITY